MEEEANAHIYYYYYYLFLNKTSCLWGAHM